MNRWDFKRYVTKCTFKFVKKKKKNYGERDYIYLKNENNPNLSHNLSLTYHFFFWLKTNLSLLLSSNDWYSCPSENPVTQYDPTSWQLRAIQASQLCAQDEDRMAVCAFNYRV